MPAGGVARTVVSALEGKKASQSAIMSAMADGNNAAKKSDPKKVKK